MGIGKIRIGILKNNLKGFKMGKSLSLMFNLDGVNLKCE
jgi:hypothetical protein